MPSARSAESTEPPRASSRGVLLLTEDPAELNHIPEQHRKHLSLHSSARLRSMTSKNVYMISSVTATRKSKLNHKNCRKKGHSKVEIYSTALRRESISGELPKTLHPPCAGSTPTALGRWDRKLVIKWALYFISFINIFLKNWNMRYSQGSRARE